MYNLLSVTRDGKRISLIQTEAPTSYVITVAEAFTPHEWFVAVYGINDLTAARAHQQQLIDALTA